MKLTEILKPSAIRVPLAATDKTGVITELVDLLDASGEFTSRDEVLRAVLEREATRSTGIGYGLAVPHGKSSASPHLVMAIGKPAEPIDFDSTDKLPVTLVVLLVSPPDKTGPHIQALARISRLMLLENFRSEINAAGSAEAVYEVIRKFEQ